MKSSSPNTAKNSKISCNNFISEKFFKEDSFCDTKAVSNYIHKLMREKNLLLSSEIYNRAELSKQTWSNIYSGKNCPTKENARKLVIGLRCTLSEAVELLSYCGLCFVPGNFYDECFLACIEQQRFNMVDVQLYMHGQEKLRSAA